MERMANDVAEAEMALNSRHIERSCKMQTLNADQLKAIVGGGSSGSAPASGSSSGGSTQTPPTGSGTTSSCPTGTYPAQLPDGSIVCVKPKGN